MISCAPRTSAGRSQWAPEPAAGVGGASCSCARRRMAGRERTDRPTVKATVGSTGRASPSVAARGAGSTRQGTVADCCMGSCKGSPPGGRLGARQRPRPLGSCKRVADHTGLSRSSPLSPGASTARLGTQSELGCDRSALRGASSEPSEGFRVRPPPNGKTGQRDVVRPQEM